VKVIHVITALNQGGAEAMLEKLVLTGRRLNPEIEQLVINLGEPGVVGDRLAGAGVVVESLGMSLSLRSVRKLFALARWLRSGPAVAVVQTWLWHADLIGGLCARAVGNRRVVWNLRNSMPRHAATKPASRAIALLCGRLSRWLPARIVCNSSAALQAHVAIGYCAEKCLVIPNGFDLRLFVACAGARSELRARWGAGADQAVIGMVARVDPLKDHATFIRAAARVAVRVPRARFVLVGEGVARDPSIQALLAETELAAQFNLEERRDDVQRVMSALDVFCLASRSEGFPNVLGEAKASAFKAAIQGDSTSAIARFLAAANPMFCSNRMTRQPGGRSCWARRWPAQRRRWPRMWETCATSWGMVVWSRRPGIPRVSRIASVTYWSWVKRGAARSGSSSVARLRSALTLNECGLDTAICTGRS
jgi:glycosyltransferase involved in cell wall biosynthesis